MIVFCLRLRRVAAGMLRGEYLSSLSKRSLPAAIRRNEASNHNPSTNSPGAIAWNETPLQGAKARLKAP